MPHKSPEFPARLRSDAEERLHQGTAPRSRGWPAGSQALTLLHKLASSADSASDALKLLHELQVHQVELDLQQEQAEQNRRQLGEALESHNTWFERAPFGYMTLDTEGHLLAANRLAASWLGIEQDTAGLWTGRRFADLLAPESRPALRDALGALGQEHGRQACAIRSKGTGESVEVTFSATPAALLLAFMPTDSTPNPH